ncbi:hypothetical protein C8Q72DRAFT_800330 [Fomitopsis betulina]|nr:hypothetical protein C8Q72DRAFT_800330 [Fomitopsis betulina]
MAQPKDAIERELMQLSTRMVELKTALNSYSPIAVLPPEIFSEIFMHAAGIYTEDAASIPAVHDLTRTSHVCKQWRAIALGCPALWSCIDLHRPLEWVAELLARSKEAPLYVSMAGRQRKLRGSSARQRWSQDTLEMALMSLERIRALKLVVTPSFSTAKEILELLDAPAPQLESLTIIDMFSRSRVEEHTGRLLARAEICGLRRLHLKQCDTIAWEKIALGNLTHLKIENHTSYMDLVDLLGALSRMPQLEELVVAGALTPDAKDTFPTQIALSRLRGFQSLRGFAMDNACLLNSLVTPSLTRLSVALESEYETQDVDAVSHASLLTTMAAKVPTLGRLLTLCIERLTGGNACISAYCEAYDGGTGADIRGWLDAHIPALQLNSQALADDTPFGDFCAFFPIKDTVSLVLRGGIPSSQSWRSLAECTTLADELHIVDVYSANPIAERLLERVRAESAEHSSAACHYALPSLRLLTLQRVHLNDTMRVGKLQIGTMDNLVDSLIERYENGVEVEGVHVSEPRYMTDRDFETLRQVVRFATCDGGLRRDFENPVPSFEMPELDDIEESSDGDGAYEEDDWEDEEDGWYDDPSAEDDLVFTTFPPPIALL